MVVGRWDMVGRAAVALVTSHDALIISLGGMI